jgi:hypothetical protein
MAGKLSEFDAIRIRLLLKMGMPRKEVLPHTEMSGERFRRHDEAPRTKILLIDLRRMKDMFASGNYSRKELALQFGISHPHACKLLKGLGRKDFPEEVL